MSFSLPINHPSDVLFGESPGIQNTKRLKTKQMGNPQELKRPKPGSGWIRVSKFWFLQRVNPAGAGRLRVRPDGGIPFDVICGPKTWRPKMALGKWNQRLDPTLALSF